MSTTPTPASGTRRAALAPMAPNQGIHAYPMFEPITDIMDAIKRHAALGLSPKNSKMAGRKLKRKSPRELGMKPHGMDFTITHHDK